MYSLKPKLNLMRLFSRTVFVGILFFVAIGIGSAQTVDDLRSDINERQQRLSQIQSEINNLQGEISRAQKQAASLRNEIALYDLQIRQTEVKIEASRIEIEQLQAKITEIQLQIQDKQEQIERQKTFLAETLRLINEYDDMSALEITLANDTFSEFLDQVTYAGNLQEKTNELLEEIKILKAQLESKRAELATELANEERTKHELVLAEGALEDQRGLKAGLLAATRGQERLYQSLLADASQKQEQIEREIFDIETAIRERLGDKSAPLITGGLLRWPMSGVLTQRYGRTGFTALGYSFHNGLDIAAPAGTTIYAAGDGIVHATGTGQAAYGNWAVIKHALSKDGKVFRIYTLYAHMRSVRVTTGQTVKAGDIVGFEGNTGNTTRLLYGPERGYHLHFTIFDEDGFGIQGGAYQHIYGPYQIPYGYTYNPLDFLK
ncbi:MAG: hypothetical protein A3C85_00610 [Candidatus Doudnabacteria bacterium RIFCSPHIGHO2_02_FULL_48_21]|uniref:M23ase beta-sheet core domain-containing protein n=1 Tax=Candidatus Doudnabacteria bacterium RIFCSPLOWO2_02_FULL_48_13 TaxID=1817845 RepID=A0A1F5Q861_9BACT|nr:MAG: hypothetical protein A3K05_04950 [Candidatus Doudnabacteria bacterium RIFCSPHIGHO2_01_48_18]OGE79380.1 MAG: hypothetical protein A2668_00430 [Candidatus Doudnabacteria bacterium RIFCSPHIGHO2_01_FULL_48_180]OGE91598.1 MAG: hypothetical protein A3F44_04490 [Candidatus Doudnabacteria bacterium RIFCSPHIGHO2_12_FULL_47_25]OGE93861.1 MAG: hypothetical protein A3C85_00610 [Candidatus Doudnabacteria bacterium RIFCSPHIGHO2_02_FULL_48_21]OGE97656.1 MAG: hypothetical protein A3A83_04575 [Candidatu